MEATNNTKEVDYNDKLEIDNWNHELSDFASSDSDYKPPKKIQATSGHNDKLPPNAILNLNDDCLLHIFSYLSLNEKFKMYKLGGRFENIFGMTFKKKLNINDLMESIDDITFPDIQQILIKFGNSIEYIEYSRIENWDWDGFITYVQQFCPHLKTFKLSYIEEVSHLHNLNLKSINKLELRNCNIDDRTVSFLSVLPELISLTLFNNCKLTGKYLNKFENLQTLLLRDCYDLKHSEIIEFCKSLKLLRNLEIDVVNEEILDVIIENLKNLENLTLFVEDNDEDRIYMHKVADIQNLKSLRLFSSSNNFTDFTDLTRKLAARNTLETFSLPDIEINTATLRLIPTIRSVKKIIIVLEEIDNEFLENCTKCNFLEYLGILNFEDLENLHVIVNLINKSKSLHALHLDMFYSRDDFMGLIEKLILDVIDVIKSERKYKPFKLILTSEAEHINKSRLKNLVPSNLSQIFELSLEEPDYFE